jgi:hypothetical protein
MMLRDYKKLLKLETTKKFSFKLKLYTKMLKVFMEIAKQKTKIVCRFLDG